MRRLLLGAAAALAAIATSAAPAEARPRLHAETAATFHSAGQQWRDGRPHQWRGDRMRWRGHDMRWRDDHRRWRGGNRHWRGHSGRWVRHDPGFFWGFGFGPRPRMHRPCRALWWDGWAWRCRW